MTDNGEYKPENKLAVIFKRLLIAVVVISLLTSSVMFVNWLNEPGNFPFKNVELVNRLKNQESRELRMIAANALNGGFFSLNVDEFRAELLSKLPWVRSVSVRKIWPDKLLVEISEHKPIVRWQSVDTITKKSEGAVIKAEGSLIQAEGSLIQAEGSIIKAKGYQLLSQEGIVFQPDLTDRQKFEFNKMALLSGPKVKAKKILEKCAGIGKDLEKLALEITHCGMDKRRTWKLSLIGNDDVNSNSRIDIKLGKENVLQQLERFIQVFSGKLKKYLSSIEYADLRYSNGFSIKWNASDTLDNTLNDVSKDESSGNNL